MSNEGLATQNYGSVVNFEDYAMSTEAVVRQVNVIQEVMKAVMKIDEHYGTIPGCQKPSLYKPGAEKLGFTFRLAPEYEVRTINMANGHREYQVKCRLRHIPTGAMVGEGEGSCTTMEGKYRFRGGEKEGTGQAIPKEYWNLKNAGKIAEAKELIGGEGFAPGKVDGKWEICSIGEKVEHDNPADYYNTCLKMAKKRAHVDAILTATAASDIFTQDVEDMPEVIPGASTTQQMGTQATTGKPPVKQPKEKKAEPAGDARDKLKAELEAYCGEDLDMMKDVVDEISFFESNGKEYRFTIADIFAQKDSGEYRISDKWIGKALGKLRDIVKENQG